MEVVSCKNTINNVAYAIINTSYMLMEIQQIYSIWMHTHACEVQVCDFRINSEYIYVWSCIFKHPNYQ